MVAGEAATAGALFHREQDAWASRGSFSAAASFIQVPRDVTSTCLHLCDQPMNSHIQL